MPAHYAREVPMNLRNAPDDIANLYPTVGNWRRDFPWSRGPTTTDTYQATFSGTRLGRPIRCKVTIGRQVIRDKAAALWAIKEVLTQAGRSRRKFGTQKVLSRPTRPNRFTGAITASRWSGLMILD